METSLPLGLYMKLCKVMAQINRLPKTGYNKAQNYAFASESDLTDMIRPLLANEGVFLFSSMDAVEQSPIESKNGAIGTHATVTMTFTFIDAETGELRASTWTGEAMDYQDKSINKAATAALKYFLLKTFLISTGETDDDADNATPEPLAKKPAPQVFNQQRPPMPPVKADTAKLSEAQRLAVEFYGDTWKDKEKEVCETLSAGYCQTLGTLKADELDAFIRGVNKKIEKAKAEKPAQPVNATETPEAA